MVHCVVVLEYESKSHLLVVPWGREAAHVPTRDVEGRGVGGRSRVVEAGGSDLELRVGYDPV